MQPNSFFAAFVIGVKQNFIARVATETSLTVIDEYGHDDGRLIMIGNKLVLSCRYAAKDKCSPELYWKHKKTNTTTTNDEITMTFPNSIVGTWHNLTLHVTYALDIFGWYKCYCRGLDKIERAIYPIVPILYRLCKLNLLS